MPGQEYEVDELEQILVDWQYMVSFIVSDCISQTDMEPIKSTHFVPEELPSISLNFKILMRKRSVLINCSRS